MTELYFTQKYITEEILFTICTTTDLIKLELYDCGNFHERLDFLKQLTNLTNLSLPYSGLTDSDLTDLQLLQNLRILELTQNNINGTGFESMSFAKLQCAILIRTAINAPGIKAICSACPNLHTFIYSGTDDAFDSDCLYQLCSNLPHLETIELFDTNVMNFDALTLCPKLKILSIVHTESPSNYIGFPEIRPEPNLKYTNQSIPILPKITFLILCRELSEFIMPIIHLFESIEHLSIRSTKADFITDNITELHNLKKLSIHAYLQSENLLWLASMTQLEELDLRYNSDLDGTVFEILNQMPNLSYINLLGTQVTAACVEANRKYFVPTCVIDLSMVESDSEEDEVEIP